MKAKKLNCAILIAILTTLTTIATFPVPTSAPTCPPCEPCAQVCWSNDAICYTAAPWNTTKYLKIMLSMMMGGLPPTHPAIVQTYNWIVGNATLMASTSDCCVDVNDLRMVWAMMLVARGSAPDIPTALAMIRGLEAANGWPPGAVMSVSPKVTKLFNDNDTGLVSHTFTVDVRIDNVVGCKGYEFKLGFDAAKLGLCLVDFSCSLCALCVCNCTYSNCSEMCTPPCINVTGSLEGENATKVTPGGFNTPGTMYGPQKTIGGVPTWAPLQNVTYGFVWAGAALPAAKSGSGVLMTIEFHIECDPPRDDVFSALNKTIVESLHLYDTSVVDALGNPIPHLWHDGCYVYERAQKVVGAPTCSFSFTPPSPVTVSTEVTCTFTGSPGSSPIVTYDWVIVSGPATWTTPNGASTRKFHCDDEGDVVIWLNVTNGDGLSAQCSKTMKQIKPTGAIQDLYTSNNRFCNQTTDWVGIGLAIDPTTGLIVPGSAYVDALAPDVEITLFVKCTWNGAPRMHVLVTLEIIQEWRLKGPGQVFPVDFELINETVAYRTAETNKDGIANITFRVPQRCDEREFGKWLVLASCKIQEIKTIDWIRFDVGYPVKLEGIELSRDTYCVYEHITLKVFYKNIQLMPKRVVFVATVYDDCDVAVDQEIVYVTALPGEYCHPKYGNTTITCLELPQWTYVGVGKVYVVALTDLPRLCGTSYCPEVGIPFTILWCP